MSTDDHSQPGPQPGGGAAPGTPPGTGDAPPEGAPPPRRPAGDGFFDSIRRMGIARSDERWVGGVAGGVAERFGLDPLLVRGLLILSFFLTGAGIVIYAIAWALLPERRDGRIHLQQAVRGDFDVALLGAVIAFVVGVAWNDGLWSWGFGLFDWVGGVLWVAVWVAVIWLIVKLVRDRRARRDPSSGGPGAPGRPTGPGGPGAPGGPTGPGPSAPPAGSPAPYAPAAGVPITPAPDAPGSPVAGRGDGPEPAAHFTPAPPAPSRTQQPQPPVAESRPVYAAAPPAASAPAPAPPQPPRPPKPRRRGPGAGTVGIVTGLVLIIGALLLVADRVGDLGVPLGPTWLGASIVVLGLGLVVCGLRGRRGGGLSWLAALALVAGIITWPFAGDQDSWDFWDDDPRPGPAAVISEGNLTPRTIEEAEDGVHVRFGSAVVDLTELDLDSLDPGEQAVVPISMTAGSTLVVIPENTAVEAQAEVIAGNLTWRVDGSSRSVNTYTENPVRFTTPEVTGPDSARLVLDVDVRAGDLTIEEGSR
ncbi:PspC domain-containing protein [Isoptericola sp. BMS4]|uniref:PspC domain-containing protein n=1 Tax=Isoptericola sp. BMS4 TaxID=2527875 RepID=UPI0014227CB8|nr:PspC domain-containing protein [Isoptericola sp. BMS4]